MKRFVIILLALLSGLSVPQAVAAASARADTSVTAAQNASRLAQPGAEVRIASIRPVAVVARTERITPFALHEAPAPAPVHFGDRARE